MQKRSEGFTLVEMAIVLVIVGLLIGGILMGQSMINTARNQAFIRQIQFYDVAVSNFKTKYNQIPGDSKLFSPAGDNDQKLPTNNGGGGPKAIYYGTLTDIGKFWVHMYEAQMVQEAYILPGTNGNYYKVVENAPPAKIGPNGTILFAETTDLNTGGSSSGLSESDLYWHVCYNFLAGTTGQIATCDGLTTSSLQGPISGIDAFSIDTKMDNGLPGSGIVQATWSRGEGINRHTGIHYCYKASSQGGTHAAGIYETGQYANIPGCDLFVKMYSQAGDSR